MSEASRGPTEPPKDVKAVWERTRDLNKRLDGLDERLGTLEGQKLADSVAELSLVVKKLAEKPEAANAGVWNWSLMSQEQQVQAWKYLLEWMEKTFRVRFPRYYKEMLGYADWATSCWYKHNDMVETLTGLMSSYHWAYTDPESGPLRVNEWLCRWLPDSVRQGKFILQECTRGEHKNPLANKQAGPNEELLNYIAALERGEVPGA